MPFFNFLFENSSTQRIDIDEKLDFFASEQLIREANLTTTEEQIAQFKQKHSSCTSKAAAVVTAPYLMLSQLKSFSGDILKQVSQRGRKLSHGGIKQWNKSKAINKIHITLNVLALIRSIESNIFDVKFKESTWNLVELYPITDTYLDNPEIELEQKKRLCDCIDSAITHCGVESLTEDELIFLKKAIGEHGVEQLNSLLTSNEFTQHHNIQQSLRILNNAQRNSLRQSKVNSNAATNMAELARISQCKGAASFQTSCLLMMPNMDGKRLSLWTKLGALGQLLNDIQDVERDAKEEIISCATYALEQGQYTAHFSALIQLTDDIIAQLQQGQSFANQAIISALAMHMLVPLPMTVMDCLNAEEEKISKVQKHRITIS